MITGKTESGFEFELEDDVLDDYELLEALNKLNKGEYLALADLADKVLGSEQKERLKEHIKRDAKKVSSKKMMDEIMQIFNAVNELKN